MSHHKVSLFTKFSSKIVGPKTGLFFGSLFRRLAVGNFHEDPTRREITAPGEPARTMTGVEAKPYGPVKCRGPKKEGHAIEGKKKKKGQGPRERAMMAAFLSTG